MDKKAWIYALVLLLFLPGCTEKKELDNLSMTNSVSFDPVYTDEGKRIPSLIKVAVGIPKPGQIENLQSTVLVAVSETPRSSRKELSNKIDKTLVNGQQRSLLFNMELAKNGIWELADSYYRDYTVSNRVQIAIVNGIASDLLSKDYKKQTSTGIYIWRLLTQETKAHEIPDTTVYSFARDYYDDGIDPVAPIIRSEKTNIQIDGIALFKNDKIVGQIASEQTLPFMLMYKSFNRGELFLPYTNSKTGKHERVMLTSLLNSRKIIVHKAASANESPEITIRLKVKGSLLEYNAATLITKTEQDRLNHDLSEALEKKLTPIVEYLQEIGADCLGLGGYVRNSMSYKAWKMFNWQKKYPDMKIRVDVEASILDFGMTQ